jgi:multimeric flavodoxin WrbA
MTEATKIAGARRLLQQTIEHLKSKKRCLFLTTSTRWSGEKGGEMPKSTQLANKIAAVIGNGKVSVLDIAGLKIYTCEGNVSAARGNTCGLKGAALDDAEKNPTGFHRCWASANNPDDELWRVSRQLFQSDCVVFFGSIRWGQMNSVYQRLLERLTWIENRHSTLGEENIVGGIDVGIIAVGQNWNGKSAVEHQKKVLGFFGFHVVDALCWNWQFTDDIVDESNKSYKDAASEFKKIFIES